MEIQKIELQLETLPSKIREQALLTAQCNKEVDEAKLEFDVSFGMALATAIAPNATEKKAKATSASKPQSLKLIEAKYKYEISKAELNYLENQYISARKLASMESDRLKVNVSGF